MTCTANARKLGAHDGPVVALGLCKPHLASFEAARRSEPPCDPNEEHGCQACGAPDPSWCQRPPVKPAKTDGA